LYCSICGEERLFEQPPCADGHGADCPELFCVECGTAVLVGSLMFPVIDLPAEPPAHAPYRAA
jgi:hypothetical protein